MHGSTWVKLIQRIPESQHENLVAVTTTGSEIMVQRLLVVDEEFFIFRGRPAGSTDQPRVLLMPFEQLNHLAFNKAPLETEVLRMFGNGQGVQAAVVSEAKEVTAPLEPPPAASEPRPPEAPKAQEAPLSPPQGAVPAKSKPAPVSKSILLARLRARLADQSKLG